MIHRPTDAIKRCLVVAVLFALPIVGWSARNVSRGLPVIPVADYGVGHLRGQGYYDWLNTWVTDLYSGARAAYPVSNRRYSQISVPTDIFLDAEDRRKATELLNELARYDGQEMPLSIDRRFARLAEERRDRDPAGIWLEIPMRRALNIWLAPAYSYGWKVELGSDTWARVAEDGLRAIVDIAWKNPGKTFVKAGITAYHLALLGGFVNLVLAMFVNSTTSASPLLIALAYALFRTAFITLLGQADPRLTIQPYALMEVAAVMALARLAAHRSARVTRE